MLLSAVSVLVVAQSSSEIPEGLMNNSVYEWEMGKLSDAWTTGYTATCHKTLNTRPSSSGTMSNAALKSN